MMKTGKGTARWFLVVALLLGVAGYGTIGFAGEDTQSKELRQEGKSKGKVAGVSKKARTISLKSKKGTEVFRFDEKTEFVEASSIQAFKKNETVEVTFRAEDGDRIATVIRKVLAKLPKGVEEIRPDELAALLASPRGGEVVLIDARPARRYEMSHLPSAISIPLGKLKEQGEKVLPQDKDRMLVFYCGGYTCSLSPKCAAIAKKLGYTNVKGMLAGEPGWKKSGRITVSTQKFVKTGNVVLIDLRSEELAEKGHVPGAVAISPASLEEAEEEFPAYMAAPVVFYGSQADVTGAVKMARSWGYKNATALEGGIEAWMRSGETVAKGALVSEIDYVRKMGAGEVGIEEFRMAADGKMKNRVILDVRSPEETAGGTISGAVCISLDELSDRLGLLDQEPEYLIHCNTGVRAEMAHHLMKKAGFRSRYLLATVEFEDGKVEISE